MMILNIFKSASGQYAGEVKDQNGKVVSGVFGCSSPIEVEEAISNTGLEITKVIDDFTDLRPKGLEDS